MLLLRLSGHSGAGKTRLVDALPRLGLSCTKTVRYTSRSPRNEEKHGEDYYFMSRSFIESLPEDNFLVGPVRNMLQAFDLGQIEKDLRLHGLVLIEIHPSLWPALQERMKKRLGGSLETASVFMTAVDPSVVASLPDDNARANFITHEVEKNLLWRNKDSRDDIRIRADAAAAEVLQALGPAGREEYSLILHSAPEGPDGADEWTSGDEPAGRAKKALGEFVRYFRTLEK